MGYVISNWLFIFRHRPSATAAATDALPSLPTKMDLPWSNAISSKRGRNGSSGESTTKTAAEQQLQVDQTSYSAVKPKCNDDDDDDVVFKDTLCSGVSHHTPVISCKTKMAFFNARPDTTKQKPSV